MNSFPLSQRNLLSFWLWLKLTLKYAGFPKQCNLFWEKMSSCQLVHVLTPYLQFRQSAFRSPCCKCWMRVRPIALAAAKLRRDWCPIAALCDTDRHSMQRVSDKTRRFMFIFAKSFGDNLRDILAKEQARLADVKYWLIDSRGWRCLSPHTLSGHNFDTTRTTSAECSPYVDHFHMYLLAICHQRSVWQARSQNSSSENCVDYVTLLPLSQRIVLDSVKVDPRVCRLSEAMYITFFEKNCQVVSWYMYCAFRSPCCNRWMRVRPTALASEKLRRDVAQLFCFIQHRSTLPARVKDKPRRIGFIFAESLWRLSWEIFLPRSRPDLVIGRLTLS